MHASLFTRRVAVHQSMINQIEYNLKSSPAKYHFLEMDARTFIIPAGQNQYIQENVFSNAPIRRIAIAMNTNSAFSGSFNENPFHYQKFGLRELRIIRGNQPIVNINTKDSTRVYVNSMKSMKFNDEMPALRLDQYEDHFIMVFDLTSLQDAGDHVYYPEVIGGSLRLEMYFDKSLDEATEVILLGERLSTIYIDKNGSVVKNA